MIFIDEFVKRMRTSLMGVVDCIILVKLRLLFTNEGIKSRHVEQTMDTLIC